MASWKRLKDNTWGVISTTPGEIAYGKAITVTKSNGTSSSEVVGNILFLGNGCVIARVQAKPSANGHTTSAVAQVNGKAPSASQLNPILPAPHASNLAPIHGCPRPTLAMRAEAAAKEFATTGERGHAAAAYVAAMRIERPAPIATETTKPTAKLETEEAPMDLSEAVKLVGRIVLFDYDIPALRADHLADGWQQFRSPCSELRATRGAIPLTESVWMIQESRFPWALKAEMDAAGSKGEPTYIKNGVWPQPESCAAMFLTRAVETLRTSIEKVEQSSAKSIETAERNLDMAETKAIEAGLPFDREKARKAFESKCKAILKHQREVLSDLEEAAKSFGIREFVGANLHTVREVCSGLQAGYRAKAASFVNMVNAAQATKYATVAATMPPQVLADMLSDEGIDAEADQALWTD